MRKIVGHNSQISQLKKAVAAGRLPNAYLFSGPKGIGKRLVADMLAAVIACPTSGKNDHEACGICAACIKVAGGNHPDQFLIEADGESIKIDQIRELQGKVQFHPLESPAKLVIIDDADKMTDSAANSLLKLLEEPPSFTHIILISSMPHRLLPTIRSRCQSIPFAPLGDGKIADFLKAENRVPEKEALRIARMSGGSLGTALTIDSEFVDGIIGRLLALTRRASSADIIETAHVWSHEDPERIRLILDILASWYRDILRCQATGEANTVIHPETIDASLKVPLCRTERNISEITMARTGLDYNANKQLMFEHLLFSLTG